MICTPIDWRVEFVKEQKPRFPAESCRVSPPCSRVQLFPMRSTRNWHYRIVYGPLDGLFRLVQRSSKNDQRSGKNDQRRGKLLSLWSGKQRGPGKVCLLPPIELESDPEVEGFMHALDTRIKPFRHHLKKLLSLDSVFLCTRSFGRSSTWVSFFRSAEQSHLSPGV
jgi:hypothetical protein